MTRPSVPRLHLVGPLSGVLAPQSYAALAALAAKGGADAVHVRLPGAAGGEVLQLSQDVIREVGPQVGATVFVNDRVDVAMLVQAGGVHLGERSLRVVQARELVGAEMLIGRSVHDMAGALQAQEHGADFIIAGHVFDTGSKPDQPGKGVEWIAELASAVTIPVIAIGGIGITNVERVIQAGAWGVAVGREILAAPDPAVVARSMRAKIEQNGAISCKA